MDDIDPRILELLQDKDYDVVMQGITIGHAMGTSTFKLLLNVSPTVLGKLFSEYTQGMALGSDHNNPYWQSAALEYKDWAQDGFTFTANAVMEMKYKLGYPMDLARIGGAMRSSLLRVEPYQMYGLISFVEDKLGLRES